MTKLAKIALLSFTLGIAACSSGDDGGNNGASNNGGGGGGGGGGTTDPIVGKACTSDSDCGSGYACEMQPGGGGGGGGGCTPNRPCTALECRDICMAQGQFDFMTGEVSAECVADCQANALCCNDTGSGGGGAPAGKCVKTGGGGGGGTSNPPGDSGTTPAPMNWAGTWNVTVEYDVKCDFGLGNVKNGHNNHTLTMQISGSGSSLTAAPQTPTSGWTEMTGTGNDSGATLSGPFPFRDNSGDTVRSTDNSVTLRITTVTSANQASGSIEGSGNSGFGAKCTISNGSLSLSR